MISTVAFFSQYRLSLIQWIRNIGIIRKAKSKNINVRFSLWAQAGRDTRHVNPFMRNTALYEEYLYVRHFMMRGFPRIPKGNSASIMREVAEYDVWLYVLTPLLKSKLPAIDEEFLLKTMKKYHKSIERPERKLSIGERWNELCTFNIT